MDKKVKTSVRNLVEFVMRSGDIDTTYISNKRALMGIKAHQKLQSDGGENYKKEYFLSCETEYQSIIFEVQGRADGLIEDESVVTIDEIKSTTRRLDSIDENFSKLHWAQVMCYGYFYLKKEEKESIRLQLSYYNLETEQTRRFQKEISFNELEDFYFSLLKGYLDFSKLLSENKNSLTQSIISLDFPFPSYRKGQRKMMESVYRSIRDKKNILIEAPTGIGKTISSIYPSLKAMPNNLIDKIFYLTARSTTKEEAQSAISILIKSGLKIRAVNITSKEKSCINTCFKCNPKDCKFAKGHFDRVNDAIFDILENEYLIDYEILKKYSLKHSVCPFEFSLDIASFVPFVICDYNYAFDPSAYLKRFFDFPVESYVFLIDEAHNLSSRLRDMYSASINTYMLLDMMEYFTGKYLNIRKSIGSLVTSIEKFRFLIDKNSYYSTYDELEEIEKKVKKITSSMDTFLEEEK